jgi:hypothetical protein
METPEPSLMQKETVIKDDGRRLIYYRFLTADDRDIGTDSPPPAASTEG